MGEGRAAYLKARRLSAPEDRYAFPQTSSQAMTWRFGPGILPPPVPVRGSRLGFEWDEYHTVYRKDCFYTVCMEKLNSFFSSPSYIPHFPRIYAVALSVSTCRARHLLSQERSLILDPCCVCLCVSVCVYVFISHTRHCCFCPSPSMYTSLVSVGV